MNKFLKYKQLLIFGGSASIVLIVTLVLFVIPQLHEISEAKTSIHDKRVQLEILKRERSNIEQTQRELSSIEENIKDLEKIFIDGEEVLNLISALETVAEDNGVEQELALLGEPTQNTFSMKLTISCTWAECLNYLSILEQLDQYVSLSDPLITRVNSRLTMSFNAYAYTK
ncbi:MAG: type 4a pilus biogenesis protein PilO [Candidatus Kerfeldbacteria bacterium]|nr:type 4a pilus biogenesis protein PilO [Candidatus Kerfeldbacteria bacterium]